MTVQHHRISNRTIDFLFRPPTVEPIVPGRQSTVHLVRREIQQTLADIQHTEDENTFLEGREPVRLFASTIVICTAFDLLAKLRFGDEDEGSVTFQRLLVEFGKLRKSEAERVWEIRNALVHSFGVVIVRRPSKKRARRLSSTRVLLTNDRAFSDLWPVQRSGLRRWHISVPGLYVLLTDILVSLERDLRQPMTTEPRLRFRRMFQRYGRISIGL
jgi:hypothetical protein